MVSILHLKLKSSNQASEKTVALYFIIHFFSYILVAQLGNFVHFFFTIILHTSLSSPSIIIALFSTSL